MLKSLAMAIAAITLIAAPVSSFAGNNDSCRQGKNCCCASKCECKDCKCSSDGKCCGKDCKCEKCSADCPCKKQ
jgi:hypothetical protein